MTRVFLADALPEERAALRLLLLDLEMEVVGEAGDWSTILAEIRGSSADMLLIDGNLLPEIPVTALAELRKVCPTTIITILINPLSRIQQANLSSDGSVLISKDETPERIASRLRSAAGSNPVVGQN